MAIHPVLWINAASQLNMAWTWNSYEGWGCSTCGCPDLGPQAITYHTELERRQIHIIVTVTQAQAFSASWIFKWIASQCQENHYNFIKPSEILRVMIKSYGSVITVITNVSQFGNAVPSRSKGEESRLIGNYITTWGTVWVTQMPEFKKCWLPASHTEVTSWDSVPFVKEYGTCRVEQREQGQMRLQQQCYSSCAGKCRT